MSTIELTTKNFEAAVAQDGITIVDFWASWCGPCRMFAPIFEQAALQHTNITFAKVDTEQEQQIAAEADCLQAKLFFAQSRAEREDLAQQLARQLKTLTAATMGLSAEDASAVRRAIRLIESNIRQIDRMLEGIERRFPEVISR